MCTQNPLVFYMSPYSRFSIKWTNVSLLKSHIRLHYSDKTKQMLEGVPAESGQGCVCVCVECMIQQWALKSEHFHVCVWLHVWPRGCSSCTHHYMLLWWCCRLRWLTSSQIHLRAAALWVAVNSTLIHSSGRVHRATVGRVCPRSPYYYPADVWKRWVKFYRVSAHLQP